MQLRVIKAELAELKAERDEMPEEQEEIRASLAAQLYINI